MRSNILWKWMQSLDAEKQWEADNPELAQAWNEAIEEAYQRSKAFSLRGAESPGDYLKRAGVGLREVDAALEADKTTEAMTCMDFWLQSNSGVLVLLGGPGCGKTVAACMALLKLRSQTIRDNDARFVRANDFARRSYYAEDVFLLDKKAHTLVIDDLGEEQSSSTFLASLDDVLSYRISAKVRTIITSNLALKAFSDRFAKPGSRLASRIHAYGKVHCVGTEDLR